MSVDNRFRNAEAETGSTVLSIVGGILLRELFENLLVELRLKYRAPCRSRRRGRCRYRQWLNYDLGLRWRKPAAFD